MNGSSASESNYGQFLKTLSSAEYPEMPKDLLSHYVENRDEFGFDPALDLPTFIEDRQSEWLYDQKCDAVMAAYEEGRLTKLEAEQLTEKTLVPLFIGNRRAKNVPVFHDTLDENNGFTFEHAISETISKGYYIAEKVLDERTLKRLQLEARRLPYKSGIHKPSPSAYVPSKDLKTLEHERYYTQYNDKNPQYLTNEANIVVKGLVRSVRLLDNYPELGRWNVNQIGYHRYRDDSHFICEDRDRTSDQLLSVIFTLTGSSIIRIFRTLGTSGGKHPIDLTEYHATNPGTVMFLRAPGFGSGDQVDYDVAHPLKGGRTLLHLNMRGDKSL